MQNRLFGFLVLFLVAATVVAQAPAPPQPPQLTWVRFFNVDPMQGEQFVAHVKGPTGAVFNRLVREGKLISWGIAQPFTMTGQEYSHAVWVTANNWSAFDEMVRAFEASMANLTAAERQGEMEMMRMMRGAPRDIILRHLVQSTTPTPAGYRPKYIRLAYYSIKLGRSDDAVALFNEAGGGSMFPDLVSRGVIGPWGLSVQEIVADPSWTHTVWYFIDDLRRLDTVMETMAARPADVRNRLNTRLFDMADMNKFRQEILHIVHMNTATPAAPPTPRPRR